MKKKKIYTTLALFSGGLDSILAVKILQLQKIKVIPVCFVSPFFNSKNADESAKKLNIKLQIIELKNDYLQIVKNPKYGYGKNLNPCIDCHSFMYKKLGEIMPKFEADFLISGEVLGQRPKSQSIAGLNAVSKLCGYKDLIIRPLSQKLLSDTKPIKENWIDKAKLYDIQGRSRTRQIDLAEKFGISSYPSPAGGCLLTDESYCNRLQDLIENDMFSSKYIKFLSIGRHFRISENTKLILGRTKDDNEKLNNLITDDLITLNSKNYPGPLGVINCKGQLQIDEVELSAQILLRYITKVKNYEDVKIEFGKSKYKILKVKKLKSGLECKYLIL